MIFPMEQILWSMLSHLLLILVLWAGPSALALAYLRRVSPENSGWLLVALLPVLGPIAVLFSYWPRKVNSA
jgi:hypothetical protein